MHKRGIIITAIVGAVGLAALAAPASGATTNEWRLSYRSSADGILYGVAAISPTNAWAAGSANNQPYVVHWNGRSWSTVTIPGSTGDSLSTIGASSASNVWVFGSDPNNQEKAFRWDGAHWHSIPSVPPEVSFNPPLVFSASNVWGYGHTSCVTGKGGIQKCVTNVWHWNGSGWKSYPIGTTVWWMAGTAATGPWVIGVNGEKQYGGPGSIAAYRWTGGRWFPVVMPHPQVIVLSSSSIGSPGIGIDSASDIWIGMSTARAQNGYVLHWNGRTWAALTAPDNLSTTSEMVPDGHGGVWLGTGAHWTGRSWVNVFPMPSSVSNATTDQMVKVPGTSGSYWDAGGVTTSATSLTYHLAMMVYGPLP